jgi:GAF domain-containing protein
MSSGSEPGCEKAHFGTPGSDGAKTFPDPGRHRVTVPRVPADPHVFVAAQSSSSSTGFFGLALWQTIAGGLLLIVLEETTRRWVGPAVARRIKAHRERVPSKLLLAFLTHIEVIGQQIAAHPAPEDIPALIRNDVLQPICTFIPTEAAEQIKVVWFRPESDGSLVAHAQVGYTDPQAKLIRLAPGAGIAGRAFKTEKLAAIPDTTKEPAYAPIDGLEDNGDLLCVPIIRLGNPTGVLSVLSTRPNSFKPAYRQYLTALAAMIAAAEALEEHSRSKQTQP